MSEDEDRSKWLTDRVDDSEIADLSVVAMPEEEKTPVSKDKISCYWESDSAPVPERRIVKVTSMKKAKQWLKNQEATEHWTPRIGEL